MTDGHDDSWLWLFSSNRRALYAQDVSNVAALPPGSRYTFRYRRHWVGDAARALWERDTLTGRSVLVVFSFQHPEHFHPPAFVPIRTGRVVASEIVGSFFTVEFEVGDYLPLRPHRRSSEDLPTMGERVRAFSREAEEVLHEGHPGDALNKSAVVSPAPLRLVDANPPKDEAWERVVEHLASSGSYPRHLFLRLLSINNTKGEAVKCIGGCYELTAGDAYELRLTHYRPQNGDERRVVRLDIDTALLTFQGSEDLSVTSGYDAVRIRFTAPYRDEPIESVVALAPSDGDPGSRVEVKIRVVPPTSEKAFRMGLATLAIAAAGMPGIWKDFDGATRWWVGVVVVVGGLVVGWSSVRSRTRLPRLR